MIGKAAEAGSIIFVHGASSSGKSTLARVAQSSAPRPFWHLSIDHFRDSGILPMERFRRGDFAWKQARGPFFDGFHRSIATFAMAGNNILLEHILEEPAWFGELAALFSGLDVFFVGLHCPLDELDRREIRRGDRRVGSAAEDFARVHQGLRYDLELSGTDPADANAQRLWAAWSTRTPARSVFAQSKAVTQPPENPVIG